MEAENALAVVTPCTKPRREKAERKYFITKRISESGRLTGLML